ncbi:MAG: chromate transporter [Candidatus Omnitrophica bacterium]|nr:chromate transporter [Candidatus Omnitrophota bacterium]
MILIKLFFTFLKIGLFTIGSGYSMLVLAQKYIVDTYQWLTMEEFTDLVAIAELTPGPIIINLATFVGTRVAGLKGAILSTVGLIIIPFGFLFIIASKYLQLKNFPFMQNFLNVIRPIAIALITIAIINLFKTSITNLKTFLIAIIAIVLLQFFKVNPIFIVIGGLIISLIFKV